MGAGRFDYIGGDFVGHQQTCLRRAANWSKHTQTLAYVARKAGRAMSMKECNGDTSIVISYEATIRVLRIYLLKSCTSYYHLSQTPGKNRVVFAIATTAITAPAMMCIQLPSVWQLSRHAPRRRLHPAGPPRPFARRRPPVSGPRNGPARRCDRVAASFPGEYEHIHNAENGWSRAGPLDT